MVSVFVSVCSFCLTFVHSAGYLLDQFIQTNSNNRTDEYGGSIENRIRFILEVISAVTNAVGVTRTSIRLGPWSRFQGESSQSAQG